MIAALFETIGFTLGVLYIGIIIGVKLSDWRNKRR